MDTISDNYILIVVVVLLLLERVPALRRSTAPIQDRWLTNLSLLLAGGIAVSIVFPIGIIQIAGDLPGGLLKQGRLPAPLEVVLVFLIMDCWRYWEHRVFHEVPLLWRVHLVHHSDTAMDITTARRHHPFEIIIVTPFALILLFALGFSVQALGFYLVVSTLSSLYTHANITLPEAIDRPLRYWLVTPAAHAIHHSSHQPQTDSNYGAVLTIWDRLFGTYSDPASTTVPSVGLEYFRGHKDSTLLSALLQPFEYSRHGLYAAPEGEPQPAADKGRPALSPEWRQALRYGGIGLLLTLLALWPTISDLMTLWSSSDSYKYAWLVMPTFIYVVGWHHRDAILAMTPSPGYSGLVLIVIAAVLWILSATVAVKLGQHIALVIALQGVALCSLGWNVYRRLLPAMLLLFLMVPCGDIMQPLLQGLTAKWIEWYAILTGLPHTIDGYYVAIGINKYIVLEGCSGLALFTMAGFLGYSFGLLIYRSLGKVLVLAALGAMLGIAVNALRVCLIVTVDWLNGSQMDLAGHADIQWIVLLTALGLLLYCASRLEQDAWATPTDHWSNAIAGQNTARLAPVLAGLTLLASFGLVQALQYHAGQSDSGSEALQDLAQRYPGSEWRVQESNSDMRLLSIPYNQNLEAVLITSASQSGFVAEYALNPENTNIWRHLKTESYRDCLQDDCVNFVHMTWKRSQTHEARHVFYTYYVGDMVTDSRLGFRIASGWDRITGSGNTAGLIGFKVRGDAPEKSRLIAMLHELRQRPNTKVSGDLASSQHGKSFSL